MRSTRKLALIAAVAAAGIVLVACGDDSDRSSGTDQAKQQTAKEAPDARAAQRLETYLRESTKDLVGSVTPKRGQVVNEVRPADGKLKIYTLLNAEVAVDDAPARGVCRAAKASRIPEAKGAVVVDAGDFLVRRC